MTQFDILYLMRKYPERIWSMEELALNMNKDKHLIAKPMTKLIKYGFCRKFWKHTIDENGFKKFQRAPMYCLAQTEVNEIEMVSSILNK